MTTLQSSDNAYIIQLERINKSIFRDCNSFSAHFKFLNNLNQIQFDLVLSKNELVNLVSMLLSYLDMGMDSALINFNNITQDMNKYSLSINQSNNYGDIIFIYQINVISGIQIPIIKISLEDIDKYDFNLVQFLYAIKDEFLYDNSDYDDFPYL